MSVENAGSMVLPTDTTTPIPTDGMSTPLPADGMSMPMDGMSMAFSADGMSMPMDADIPFPVDETEMSFPLDETMSMPIDEAMSLDLTMSLPMGAEVDEDACDEESHPVVTVSQSFEVDTFGDQSPEGILSDVLMTAIVEAGFSLCPESTRKLWGRILEESVVLGVKVDGVKADDDETCTSATDCEVVTAEFDVIHKDGSSGDAATKEFLEKLEAQVAGGVRVRADTSSPSDSTAANPIEVGTSDDDRLSAPVVAMASVLSVACVAVALVLIQRKLSKMKRDDDKSFDGSMSTAPNTTHDTSFMA